MEKSGHLSRDVEVEIHGRRCQWLIIRANAPLKKRTCLAQLVVV